MLSLTCHWNVIEIYYLSKAIIRPFHSPSKQYSPNTVQSPWPQNISSKPYRSTLVCNLKEATFGTNWRSYQHKKNKINRAGNSDEWRTQNCPPQNCPPKGISRAGNSEGNPRSFWQKKFNDQQLWRRLTVCVMVGMVRDYIEALRAGPACCVGVWWLLITKDIVCFLYLAFQDLGGCLLAYKTFVAHIGSEHKGSYLRPIWPPSVWILVGVWWPLCARSQKTLSVSCIRSFRIWTGAC